MRKWLHDVLGWHRWKKITYRAEIPFSGMSSYRKGRRCEICEEVQDIARHPVPQHMITHQT
jgi:hypothetical protein